MYGQHCIRTYCSTQASIALSSAEAEYCGLVKASSVALGLRSLYADFDETVTIHAYTDASSAKSISTRKGLGKIRHLAVHLLWLQEKTAAGEVLVHKVRGDANPADMLTKYLPQASMNKFMSALHYYREDGRAAECPELAKGDI